MRSRRGEQTADDGGVQDRPGAADIIEDTDNLLDAIDSLLDDQPSS